MSIKRSYLRRTSPRTRTRNHPEDDLQELCVRWFRWQYPGVPLYSIPNGARTSISIAVRLKRTGLLKGIPDLFLSVQTKKYPGLYIEMKSEKGRLSPEQRDMIQTLKRGGYRVEVCRSFEEFVAVIESYLFKEDLIEELAAR